MARSAPAPVSESNLNNAVTVLTLELLDAEGNVNDTLVRFVAIGETMQVSDAGGPLCRIRVERPLVLPGQTGREVLN